MPSEDVGMRLVLRRIIPAKPLDVFRRILNVEDFSQYMPNVRESRILSRNENRVKTQWSVELDGLPMSWVEEETIDLLNLTIFFRAVEGDLSKFDGKWIIRRHWQGTEVEIDVRASVGIPMVERLIAPVLKEKIGKNFMLMLDAIHNRIVSERYMRFRQGKAREIGGFAIIGHPYNLNNLVRYLKYLEPRFEPPSEAFLTKIYEMVPSYVMHDIRNFTSANGTQARGLIVVSTFIPEMININPDLVLTKVIEACRVAENHGIGIAALGGFTSIVGERYPDQIKDKIHIPLTTGNTYTVALTLDQVRRACDWMGVDMARATVCVIGGTGDIGSGCARILAEEAEKIIVTGRSAHKVEETIDGLRRMNLAQIEGATDNVTAVAQADIVIAAASVTGSIMSMEVFKPGAVICDLAYPKNISYSECQRQDILIFSGGLVQIPQEIQTGFEIGLPSARTLYGCFAEAILLELARRYESFSYGRGNITRAKVEEINAVAREHGFEAAPFYWGKKQMSREDVENIRKSLTGRP